MFAETKYTGNETAAVSIYLGFLDFMMLIHLVFLYLFIIWYRIKEKTRNLVIIIK